jgi:hypothetical protein
VVQDIVWGAVDFEVIYGGSMWWKKMKEEEGEEEEEEEEEDEEEEEENPKRFLIYFVRKINYDIRNIRTFSWL